MRNNKYSFNTNLQRLRCFRLKHQHKIQFVFAFLLVLTLVFISLKFITEQTRANSSKGTIYEETRSAVLQLRSKIKDINKIQLIQNFNRDEITNETVVIMIQVHKRIFYLEKLIQSLATVRGINSTVLIFSHDHFSDDINMLVKSIDFAPVMQIFFPFSTQLYPDEFPGTSPYDCPWNLDIKKAKTQRCVGADTPDAYGHFRQAHITQTKHHWWWKINRVFEKLTVTKNFNGFVLFLEEDHYLAPDVLHVLRLMTDIAANKCSGCNIFNVGTFIGSYLYPEHFNKVYVKAPWNNLGFAFNRTLWQVLKRCSHVFCTFDDYNWDWSFLFTVEECFPNILKPLVVHTSRVFHIGNCGLHHNGTCNLNESMTVATNSLEVMEPFLFPQSLKLVHLNFSWSDVNKGWGGWSDPRDIELCLNINH